jgi:3-methyladenine DNA glycosylase AlkD
VRQKRFVREAKTVTLMLLGDQDEMVLKGVGWLLREQAKYDVENAMPLLRSIRARAPRLILRTACETLHPGLRTEILGNPRPKRLRLSQAAD